MVPEAGDIFWVELDPVRGSEQAGRRPAIIVSDRIYHEVSRRIVICPITSAARHWPFNVPVPEGLTTKGVVLVDQVRAVERSERLFDFIERAPEALLAQVQGKLAALIGIAVLS